LKGRERVGELRKRRRNFEEKNGSFFYDFLFFSCLGIGPREVCSHCLDCLDVQISARTQKSLEQSLLKKYPLTCWQDCNMVVTHSLPAGVWLRFVAGECKAEIDQIQSISKKLCASSSA
jgi:hypothetical protein